MTKCKFYHECKNQQLLWDLYVGIAKDAKKKPAAIMGPICGYCKRCQKNQWLLWRLYAGIATNEECAQLFMPYMRVLQGMQNVSDYYGTHMRVLQGI